ETMGVAIVSGREFTAFDRVETPAVAIVNETFARRMFPEGHPIGRRMSIPRFAGDTALSEIVGVAADIKYERLTEAPRMYLYVPLWQRYQPHAVLLVRAPTAEASSLVGSVSALASALDGHAPVSRPQVLSARLRASIGPQRLAAAVATAFGVIALALASVGLYGVLAYFVGV